MESTRKLGSASYGVGTDVLFANVLFDFVSFAIKKVIEALDDAGGLFHADLIALPIDVLVLELLDDGDFGVDMLFQAMLEPVLP